MNSALYRGVVTHRRLEPVGHEFRYPTCHALLDLDELEQVFSSRLLWSLERPNFASFRRADYLGPPERPLAEAVRDRVEQETGRRPLGSVRLLTTLRMLGLCFNPVSFYWCHDRDGELRAIVAEINNTPWNERHAYCLPVEPGSSRLRWRFPKGFHVSPFLPMELEHDWRFTRPGSRLAVHMIDRREGRPVFEATLAAERRPLSSAEMAKTLLRFPAAGLQTLGAIYWQALRLKLKGAPFFPHPERHPRPAEESP